MAGEAFFLGSHVSIRNETGFVNRFFCLPNPPVRWLSSAPEPSSALQNNPGHR